MVLTQFSFLHNFSLILPALLLDMIFGDPVFPFHPVRLIGRLITAVEKFLRVPGKLQKFFGTIGVLLVITTAAAFFAGLSLVLSPLPGGKDILGVITLYFTLALKDLGIHGRKVQEAFEKEDISLARERTSYLITRDTDELDETALVRCTIESISENTSDSVTAPLFWAFIFGPPGALVYRVINTLDAMWGYKNEKYLRFGRTAARFDDIAGWLPSRITGVLTCLAAPLAGGSIRDTFKIMLRDHGKTESPNAGYPEAAAAGTLGIKLAGNGIYFGKVKVKPTLGEDRKAVTPEHIRLSMRLLYGVTVLLILIFLTAAVLTASLF